MKFTTSLFAVFSAFSAVASSAALPFIQRDVYVPAITSPTADTVWTTGQTVNVTWDASNPPAQITNPIGQVWLRPKVVETSADILVIAKDFLLTDGSVEAIVPDVEAGQYTVVLFGDSGNFSPEFTVQTA